MIEWWNQLPTEYQIFYGIGMLALLIVVTQMLLTLIGVGGEGTGSAVDIGDFDSSSGIGLFSSQTLSAFFLGFGWVGVSALKLGLSVWLAAMVAFVFGFGAMFAMFYMLRALLRLQSRGNLKYASAVGEEATVYVTIPGDNIDGGGQIQVNIQGRLTTATALKSTPGALRPGERVRVTGLDGLTSFTVEALEPLPSSQSESTPTSWKS